jgi:NADH-quinone oxidoreductase subunit E/NADP-reducing hydrogenase subunit HndA
VIDFGFSKDYYYVVGIVVALQKAQERDGYINEAAVAEISDEFGVSRCEVFSVATFYHQFTFSPKGKNVVAVCMGTACFVRGASAVVDEFLARLNAKVGETTEDGEWSVDCLRCVGACGLAPVLTINGKVYARVAAGDVKGILEEYGVKEAVK